MKNLLILVVVMAANLGVSFGLPTPNSTKCGEKCDEWLPRYSMNSYVVNWIDGQRQCKSLGKRFATLKTEAQVKNFLIWLNNENQDYAQVYWLGGKYVLSPECKRENTIKACWKWVDENGFPEADIDPEEVNLGFDSSHGMGQDSRITIRMNDEGVLVFSPEDNNSIYKFICETTQPTSPTTKPPCECP